MYPYLFVFFFNTVVIRHAVQPLFDVDFFLFHSSWIFFLLAVCTFYSFCSALLSRLGTPYWYTTLYSYVFFSQDTLFSYTNLGTGALARLFFWRFLILGVALLTE